MRYLVTADEMRQYDANTIEKIGIPGMVLMERAALAAAEFLTERFRPTDGRVLVMAGMGNNGGDGLAMARILSEAGFSVDVWSVGDESRASEQRVRQSEILKNYDVRVCGMPRDAEYIILVDALFGVGLGRDIEGSCADAVAVFNRMNGFKLALDVPSGVDSDTGSVLGCAVQADVTMTLGFCKRGLLLYPGNQYAGEIFIADIGITAKSFFGNPPGMFCYEAVEEAIPFRDPAGNKGTFGKVLLIAGSDKMAGAAVLAAKSAYRSGAGMVKVITGECNRVILQETVPEALFGTQEDLEQGMEWADVIAIGPGLGTQKQAKDCLEKVIRQSGKPLLIDADGLNLLAGDGALQEELAAREGRTILTPHVGELSRLTGTPIAELKKCLWERGRELAEKLQAVVAVKDARTFICAKDMPICMNAFGNSGMATAGSGDVLTGVIAGILAQIYGGYGKEAPDPDTEALDAYLAVCRGVVLHAAAGDLAAARKGEHGCMAGDIAEAVTDIGGNAP